ncbi:hypothetical protein PR048_004667 [Dryococelus australis]|uniref:Uncharacterized protein n=1 Tax=Dryococelus australis TaxID=614101 RepID=A0ABQ9I756_9NEOP|nr:hypothetical protein PR048_004667 [Dryococelus australis]
MKMRGKREIPEKTRRPNRSARFPFAKIRCAIITLFPAYLEPTYVVGKICVVEAATARRASDAIVTGLPISGKIKRTAPLKAKSARAETRDQHRTLKAQIYDYSTSKRDGAASEENARRDAGNRLILQRWRAHGRKWSVYKSVTPELGSWPFTNSTASRRSHVRLSVCDLKTRDIRRKESLNVYLASRGERKKAKAVVRSITKRFDYSPLVKAKRVQSPAGFTTGFLSGNRARRCRWSAGFLADLQFPSPLNSDAAPSSPHFTPRLSRHRIERRRGISEVRSMERHHNIKERATGERRENPPDSGTVRYYSHMRKSRRVQSRTRRYENRPNERRTHGNKAIGSLVPAAGTSPRLPRRNWHRPLTCLNAGPGLHLVLQLLRADCCVSVSPVKKAKKRGWEDETFKAATVQYLKYLMDKRPIFLTKLAPGTRTKACQLCCERQNFQIDQHHCLCGDNGQSRN